MKPEIHLTNEEWQRLAAVTPKERKNAIRSTKRWISWYIIASGFNLEHGPFSRAAMGGDADDVC